MIAQRRSMAVKKRDATSSGTALHLRQQAQADRALEQERRDERRALERRAALEDLDAKRALELAKAEAAAERRREADTCRLARNEQDARMEKAARAAEDARWLQVDFPLELANRLIAWHEGLTPDQVASLKARITHLIRFGRIKQEVKAPYFWTEDTRFTCALGNVLGVDKARHSVRCSKSFEWLLYKAAWAPSGHNDAIQMLHRFWDKVIPDGRLLFQLRYTSGVLLHDNQYVMEKAFVHGVFIMYRWLGAGWLPGGEFAWPPVRGV